MIIKRKTFIFILVVLISILIQNIIFFKYTNASSQICFYVDCLNGNDNNDGKSIQRAFKTIEKAKKTIRLYNKHMTSDICVYIRGGIYKINSTLNFDTNDSGTNGYKIKYLAYNKEIPIITGSIDLSGNWTLHDKAKNIYKKTGITEEFRQIYVNGTTTIRARIPNIDEPFYSIISYNQTEKVVNIDASIIKNWNNLKKIEFVPQLTWAQSFLRMSLYKINNNIATLYFQDPEKTRFFNLEAPYRRNGDKFHFENAYEFIDKPKEWYFDKHTNTLYYKPNVEEDMSTAIVIAPKIEKLINIEGSSLLNQVHDIEFEGITFKYSNWFLPNIEGFVEIQALYNSGGLYVPGAVNINYSKNIKIERCNFKFLGAHAIRAEVGIDNLNIVGNVITDISGSGIVVGKLDGKVYISKNIIIKNNYIQRIGLSYNGGVGIQVGYAQDSAVDHNEVGYTPYTGISFGWGWRSDINCRNNSINYNYVHDCMNILDDGGAIYTLSKQLNSTLSHNYLKNTSVKACGGVIFLDQCTEGFTVKKNVIENAPNRWIDMWTPSIKNNNIFNNFSNVETLSNKGVNCNILNTVIFKGSDYPLEVVNIISKAGIEEGYKDIIPFKKDNFKMIFRIGSHDILINGEIKRIDPANNVTPILKYNRTFLPIAVIIEALGGRIEYLDSEKKVIITVDDKIITFIVNKKEFFVNNKMYLMDVAPIIINNRTMIPVRVILENIGCKVNWNSSNQITIIK